MKTTAVFCAAVLGITVGHVGPASADKEKYTMEDLNALAENESWSEILEHLEDVRPRERKKAWKGLLVQAATGQLSHLEGQKERWQSFMAARAILDRYPILKKSKKYMNKRGEVALLAFEECFQNRRGGGQCVEELKKFVEGDESNVDLWFKAGKLIVDKGRMYQAAPPFFEKGLANKKIRKKSCGDKSVASAVLRSFGQPPDYANAKAATKIAFDYCYKNMKGDLMKAFHASSGYERRNLCRGLTSKKAKLSGFQKAVCKDELAK